MVRVPLRSIVCANSLLATPPPTPTTSAAALAPPPLSAADGPRMRAVWEYVKDDADRIAIFLLRERAKGVLAAMNVTLAGGSSPSPSPQGSAWWPYINVLPRSVPVPSAWSSQELAALHDDRAAEEATEHRRSLLSRYASLAPAIREALRDLPLPLANAAYAAHEMGITVEEAAAMGFGSTAPPGKTGAGSSGSGNTGGAPSATPVPSESSSTVDLLRGTVGGPAAGGVNAILSSSASSFGGGGPAAQPGLPGFGCAHDSIQSFVWAAALVDSRALTIRGRKYLVPFSDMVNYAPAPGAVLRERASGDAFLRYHRLDLGGAGGKSSSSGGSSAGGGDKWKGGSLSVHVDRAVAPGEQVYEDYGDSDTGIYVQHHAMVPLEWAPRDAAASEGGATSSSSSSSSSTGLPLVRTGNPFDCIYLPIPPIRGGPKGSVPARRRALAQALGMNPNRVNGTCIGPPPLPLASTSTSTASSSAARLLVDETPDPVPILLHRWMDIAAMTSDDLSSPACENIVKRAAAGGGNGGGNSGGGGREGSFLSRGSDTAITEDLIRVCFREDEDGGAASAAGWAHTHSAAAAADTGADDGGEGSASSASSSSSSSSSPSAPQGTWGVRRARLARILRRVLSSLPTTVEDDEGALQILSAGATQGGESAVASALSSALASPSAAGAARVAASLRPLNPEAAWIALAYRTTRKRMATTLQQFYARTGPWGPRKAPAATREEGGEGSVPAPAPTPAPAVPAAATPARTPPSPSAPSSSSSPLVQIGLVSMSPRDAAAYFTEAEYASVLAQCEAFNSWMSSFRPAVNSIRAAPVGGGMRLGAVTVEPVKRESVYLAVPTDAIMDARSAAACPILGPALAKIKRRFPQGDDFHELLFHAIVETRVKLPAGNSTYGPYLALLPDEDHMLFPAFYTEEELAALDASPLVGVVRRYKEDVAQKFASMKREIFDAYPSSFPPAVFTAEAYTWGTAIMDSRAIWWGGKRHLVPLLDLINCAEGPDPSRVHATRLDARSEYAVTRADRDYEAGAQLWENYGQPNWVYFQFHGFSLLQNTHDCVRVELNPPTEIRDALVRRAKLHTRRTAAAASASASASASAAAAAKRKANGVLGELAADGDGVAAPSASASAGAGSPARSLTPEEEAEDAATDVFLASLGPVPDYFEVGARMLDELEQAGSGPVGASAALRMRVGQGPFRLTPADRVVTLLRNFRASLDDTTGIQRNCVAAGIGKGARSPAAIKAAKAATAAAATAQLAESSSSSPSSSLPAYTFPSSTRDPETEEAIQFIQVAWDTDRLGALLILRGIAAAKLKTYRRPLDDDVRDLLADSAAQVVLGLATEEDAGQGAEALLAYAYGTAEDEAGAAGAPFTFASWQQLVLDQLRAGVSSTATGGGASAEAERAPTGYTLPAARALLPPRIRGAIQYVVTEKVQLRSLMGVDPRGRWSVYSPETGSCEGDRKPPVSCGTLLEEARREAARAAAAKAEAEAAKAAAEGKSDEL
jgi:hypothetical protein